MQTNCIYEQRNVEVILTSTLRAGSEGIGKMMSLCITWFSSFIRTLFICLQWTSFVTETSNHISQTVGCHMTGLVMVLWHLLNELDRKTTLIVCRKGQISTFSKFQCFFVFLNTSYNVFCLYFNQLNTALVRKSLASSWLFLIHNIIKYGEK